MSKEPKKSGEVNWKELHTILNRIANRLNDIFKLQLTSLLMSQPTEDAKKKIDNLRGFSRQLYDLLALPRTTEELSQLTEKVSKYVSSYVGELRGRGLVTQFTIDGNDYWVRKFAYSPLVVSKEVEVAKEKPEEKLTEETVVRRTEEKIELSQENKPQTSNITQILRPRR